MFLKFNYSILYMTQLIAEQIIDIKNITGECPIWCIYTNTLFWTDIAEGKLFSYTPKNNKFNCIYNNRKVGGFTLQKDGSLLLFRDLGNIVVWDKGKEINTIIDAIPDMKNTRFNDVIATPNGSVIAGTLGSESLSGQLYQVFSDGTYKVLLENQGIPNGMAFSNDLKYMFYQDSKKNTLWRFDYNIVTDSLYNIKKIASHFDTEYPGRGDGLCIDQKNKLFSGRYEGGCVLIEDDRGVLNSIINIPNTTNVTSCTFGGGDMMDLYITTAGGLERNKLGEKSGSLFKISLKNINSKGRAEFRTSF